MPTCRHIAALEKVSRTYEQHTRFSKDQPSLRMTQKEDSGASQLVMFLCEGATCLLYAALTLSRSPSVSTSIMVKARRVLQVRTISCPALKVTNTLPKYKTWKIGDPKEKKNPFQVSVVITLALALCHIDVNSLPVQSIIYITGLML